MLTLSLVVVVVCVLALVVGQGIWALVGSTSWVWHGAATGFAALMVVASAALQLPGEGATALVAILLLTVGALVVLRRRAREVLAGLAAAVPTALLVLVVATLPFLIAGRVEPLGVAFNADFAGHLVLAEALRTGSDPVNLFYSPDGYPSGPHALVAAIAEAGVGVERAFIALLLVVPVLTALTVLGVLGSLRPGWRVVAAALVGLPFLGASWLMQSAFKEPIQALVVLGIAVSVRELWRAKSFRVLAAVPLGLLAGATVLNFSFVGIVWPVAAGLACAAMLVLRGGWRPRRAAVPAVARGLGLFVVVVALAAVPESDKLTAFFGETVKAGTGEITAGNVYGEVSAFSATGVWMSPDFRGYPTSSFYAGGATGFFALVAVGFAAAWWLRRRDELILAATVACIAVYVFLRQTSTPYFTVKALVVLAPLVMLMVTAALLQPLPRPRELLRFARGSPGRYQLAAALLFLALAGWSTALPLRDAEVGPRERASELGALREFLGQSPTLFLGQEEYLYWEMLGVPVRTARIAAGHAELLVPLREGKQAVIGLPVDFDSVAPTALDEFRFAVAPRTTYASTPPSNWHLRKTTRSYEVWERRGPTLPRKVLEGSGAPGALLDCRVFRDRRISRRAGTALVLPFPVTNAPGGWADEQGRPTRFQEEGFATVPTGSSASQRLTLRPGLWDLSLQYRSPTDITVTAPGFRAVLPAHQDRGGPHWRVGTFLSLGRTTTVTVSAEGIPWPGRQRPTVLGGLAATRAGTEPRIVALRKACGKYVDWYRFS